MQIDFNHNSPCDYYSRGLPGQCTAGHKTREWFINYYASDKYAFMLYMCNSCREADLAWCVSTYTPHRYKTVWRYDRIEPWIRPGKSDELDIAIECAILTLAKIYQ